jgi:hypothetical protein
MYNLEREVIKEAYEETMKKIYGDAVDEVFTVSAIEGNWGRVVANFHNILNNFDMLAKIGAHKDKKYGKRFRKIQSDIEKLGNDSEKFKVI